MPNSFIENPTRNISENLFRFSTDNKYIVFPRLQNLLSSQQITPVDYPRVIDLGSGDGGVAAFLIQLGWENTNITCVDKFVAPYPAVTDVIWQYVDIDNLARELGNEDRNTLDPRLIDLQEQFDLITSNFVSINDQHMARLATFLLRPNGIAVIDWKAKRREQFLI